MDDPTTSTAGAPPADTPAEPVSTADQSAQVPTNPFELNDSDADYQGETGTHEPTQPTDGDGQQETQQPTNMEGFDLTGSGVSEDLHPELASAAVEFGLSGAAASGYLRKAIEISNARIAQQQQHEEAALRKEWGDRFAERTAATKAFIVRAAQKGQIPLESLRPIMTASGMRLFDAFRRALGEPSGAAGAGASRPMSREAQLDAIFSDPKSQEIFLNPSHPSFKSLNSKINRLMGIE